MKETMQKWKTEMLLFEEKTAAFYAGELSKGEYKAISGRYGSYAQRGGRESMLRLRMTAGRVTKEKLAFTAEMIRKYKIDKIHFTTCQTIQLHDLKPDAVCRIAEEALDAGIITMGGGGDYPRNVMCSPLSGVEREEYFDVLPWAEGAGEYLTELIMAETGEKEARTLDGTGRAGENGIKKLPRKLKVGFSNSRKNLTHATFRDLGFAARKDGRFDVYSAGGLGNYPRLGVKVAEAVEPEKILYYVKAMWLTFTAYGNYQNRGRARSRYMQETLGGPEEYKKAYLQKLREVMDSGRKLDICGKPQELLKKGDKALGCHRRIIPQKQEGLYAVVWHPIGGMPSPEEFCLLNDAVQKMEDVELRLSPDSSAYVINLTGREAEKILDLTKESAETEFETSVSCIGSTICQIGLRDSQGLLRRCVDAVRKAGLPDGALPQIHISGCPSSCGAHQTAMLGFRGAAKSVNGKMQPAFLVFMGGEERQGKEQMGRELGVMLEEKIPDFLVELGKHAAESGLDFPAWYAGNKEEAEKLATGYLGES